LEEKNADLEYSLKNTKRLEANLIFEHERMKTIFSSVSEAIFVTDTLGDLMLYNEAAKKSFEIPSNTGVGKNISEMFKLTKENDKEIPKEQRPINRSMSENREQIVSKEDNFFCKLPSGKRFPVVIIASPLRQSDRIVGSVSIFRDITSEKKLDESKNSFISTASHQLRTPLTSLRWFSEMLMEGDAGRINKNQKTFLNNIYEGVARMINLVNLLLQLARVEAGRVEIEPVAVNLSKMAENVAVAFKADLEKKKQKVAVEAVSGNVPDIYMDYDVAWQVLQNLISNAVRYSSEKGTIKVKIEKKDKFVELSVKDEGIGIPKNQQERIFEKFYRANNAMQAVPEGSGLGLALVKLLVEGWGGSVRFESKEGKGTTFYITVPLSGMKAKEGEVKLAV